MTTPVNGSGNNFNLGTIKNFQIPGFRVEQPTLTPLLSLNTNTVGRNELPLVNPYGNADVPITEAREIASTTNDIMAKLGYPNFKVSPKTVASVTDGLNNQTIPSLNIADDNAVAARVATPKGPFADIFA